VCVCVCEKEIVMSVEKLENKLSRESKLGSCKFINCRRDDRFHAEQTEREEKDLKTEVLQLIRLLQKLKYICQSYVSSKMLFYFLYFFWFGEDLCGEDLE